MKCSRGNFYVIFLLFYSLLSPSCAWDNDDFEIFDVVEDVNQNFYELLGVKQGASGSELRRAYRQLAREIHPDKNKADNAEEKFRQLAAVYEILKDEKKRNKYNEVLEHGLPDWRQPIFYYRRVRKLGLLELAALLFVILTIGQYFVKWAMYLEKKLVMEEAFTNARKKKDKKKLRSKQAREDAEEEEELAKEQFLNLLPKPQFRDLMPCKLVLLIVHTVTHVPEMYQSYRDYQQEKKERELRRLEEEAEAEESSEEEEVEVVKRKPKRRVKPEVPELDEELYREKPVVYNETKALLDENAEEATKEGEWSREEYVQLGKAVTKFPPGTVKRWEKIADLLCRPVSEVIAKSKVLKNTYGTTIDPSMQGTTGHEDFSKSVQSSISDGQISTRLDLENQKDKNDSEESQVRRRQKPKNKKVTEKTLAISKSESSSSDVKLNGASDVAGATGDEEGLAKADGVKVWTQNQQKAFEWGLAQYPKGTPDRWGQIAKDITGKTKEDCIERFKFLAEMVKKRKQATAAKQ